MIDRIQGSVLFAALLIALTQLIPPLNYEIFDLSARTVVYALKYEGITDPAATWIGMLLGPIMLYTIVAVVIYVWASRHPQEAPER